MDTNCFEVLTGEEVEAVKESALRILQRVGVRVQDPEVRRIFAAAGGVEVLSTYMDTEEMWLIAD